MSLVIAQGISLSYGSKTLFDASAFTIGPTDRIGLVGANGTGKSTLLKIAIGTPKATECAQRGSPSPRRQSPRFERWWAAELRDHLATAPPR